MVLSPVNITSCACDFPERVRVCVTDDNKKKHKHIQSESPVRRRTDDDNRTIGGKGNKSEREFTRSSEPVIDDRDGS